VLSYRLLWFESRPIRKYPKQALAAISTHDLFTLAGLWSGADFQEQEKLGLHPDAADRRRLIQTLRQRLRLPKQADLAAVILKTHELVAQCPSRLLAASLDDVLAVNERPNMPGTTNRPNWSLALPLPLREIQRSALVGKICRRIREIRNRQRS
jgi:4-alpha-glucanotransferase